MQLSVNLFTGQPIKDTDPTTLKKQVTDLYLYCIAALNYTKPNEDALMIQIEIIAKDLTEQFKFLHVTELPYVFHQGVRGELGDYTVFSPVSVFKWLKSWQDSPDRSRARTHYLNQNSQNQLPEHSEQNQVDFKAWEKEALDRHKANKGQSAGLHILYEHLKAENRIKKDWSEYRQQAINRATLMLHSGKGNKNRIKEMLRTAEFSDSGDIKYLCIELAMEEYFDVVG